uniref:Uncharacterized protein n=1 Tax=Pelodiscus sinensis TaxID=13735 RepID=K7EXA7_PELSI
MELEQGRRWSGRSCSRGAGEAMEQNRACAPRQLAPRPGTAWASEQGLCTASAGPVAGYCLGLRTGPVHRVSWPRGRVLPGPQNRACAPRQLAPRPGTAWASEQGLCTASAGPAAGYCLGLRTGPVHRVSWPRGRVLPGPQNRACAPRQLAPRPGTAWASEQGLCTASAGPAAGYCLGLRTGPVHRVSWPRGRVLPGPQNRACAPRQLAPWPGTAWASEQGLCTASAGPAAGYCLGLRTGPVHRVSWPRGRVLPGPQNRACAPRQLAPRPGTAWASEQGLCTASAGPVAGYCLGLRTGPVHRVSWPRGRVLPGPQNRACAPRQLAPRPGTAWASEQGLCTASAGPAAGYCLGLRTGPVHRVSWPRGRVLPGPQNRACAPRQLAPRPGTAWASEQGLCTASAGPAAGYCLGLRTGPVHRVSWPRGRVLPGPQNRACAPRQLAPWPGTAWASEQGLCTASAGPAAGYCLGLRTGPVHRVSWPRGRVLPGPQNRACAPRQLAPRPGTAWASEQGLCTASAGPVAGYCLGLRTGPVHRVSWPRGRVLPGPQNRACAPRQLAPRPGTAWASEQGLCTASAGPAAGYCLGLRTGPVHRVSWPRGRVLPGPQNRACAPRQLAPRPGTAWASEQGLCTASAGPAAGYCLGLRTGPVHRVSWPRGRVLPGPQNRACAPRQLAPWPGTAWASEQGLCTASAGPAAGYCLGLRTGPVHRVSWPRGRVLPGPQNRACAPRQLAPRPGTAWASEQGLCTASAGPVAGYCLGLRTGPVHRVSWPRGRVLPGPQNRACAPRQLAPRPGTAWASEQGLCTASAGPAAGYCLGLRTGPVHRVSWPRGRVLPGPQNRACAPRQLAPRPGTAWASEQGLCTASAGPAAGYCLGLRTGPVHRVSWPRGRVLPGPQNRACAPRQLAPWPGTAWASEQGLCTASAGPAAGYCLGLRTGPVHRVSWPRGRVLPGPQNRACAPRQLAPRPGTAWASEQGLCTASAGPVAGYCLGLRTGPVHRVSWPRGRVLPGPQNRACAPRQLAPRPGTAWASEQGLCTASAGPAAGYCLGLRTGPVHRVSWPRGRVLPGPQNRACAPRQLAPRPGTAWASEQGLCTASAGPAAGYCLGLRTGPVHRVSWPRGRVLPGPQNRACAPRQLAPWPGTAWASEQGLCTASAGPAAGYCLGLRTGPVHRVSWPRGRVLPGPQNRACAPRQLAPRPGTAWASEQGLCTASAGPVAGYCLGLRTGPVHRVSWPRGRVLPGPQNRACAPRQLAPRPGTAWASEQGLCTASAGPAAGYCLGLRTGPVHRVSWPRGRVLPGPQNRACAPRQLAPRPGTAWASEQGLCTASAGPAAGYCLGLRTGPVHRVSWPRGRVLPGPQNRACAPRQLAPWPGTAWASEQGLCTASAGPAAGYCLGLRTGPVHRVSWPRGRVLPGPQNRACAPRQLAPRPGTAWASEQGLCTASAGPVAGYCLGLRTGPVHRVSWPRGRVLPGPQNRACAPRQLAPRPGTAWPRLAWASWMERDGTRAKWEICTHTHTHTHAHAHAHTRTKITVGKITDF